MINSLHASQGITGQLGSIMGKWAEQFHNIPPNFKNEGMYLKETVIELKANQCRKMYSQEKYHLEPLHKIQRDGRTINTT